MEHALAGRWKYGEDYVRNAVLSNTEKIQSLKSQVILFDGFDEKEIHWISVDTVNYESEELRLNPSTNWYNHKKNGAGFKYEYALALRRVSFKDLENNDYSTKLTRLISNSLGRYAVKACVYAWPGASRESA